jgi:hypothetical protein
MKMKKSLLSALVTVLTIFTVSDAHAVSIRGEIRKRDPEFKRCYDEEMKRTGKVKGRINVRVVIDRTGKVVDASATKNTTKSESLATCVVDTLVRIPFGKRKKARTTLVHVFKYPRR